MTKLIRFCQRNSPSNHSWGVFEDGRLLDLRSTEPFESLDLNDVIADWKSYREDLAEQVAEAADVTETAELISPIAGGGKVMCIGLNYRDHAIETGMQIPTEPIVFNKLLGALAAHEQDIALPKVASKVDWEAELVVVIGKRVFEASADEAEEAIFGYTCGNDVSARDWQIGRPGGQWLLGKSFPGFGPVGPFIMPKGDLPDILSARISLRIDGETMQDSNTSQLIFKPVEVIQHITKCCELHPGDVIFTGTPPGVGTARKPPRFLKSGEVVEVEIEGLGMLRNRFI